tara:strand:- start:311 stop:436 length:126 start_codon:yes stop_codon:yes gene_type:complete
MATEATYKKLVGLNGAKNLFLVFTIIPTFLLPFNKGWHNDK